MMWGTVVIVGANGPVGQALIDELVSNSKCSTIVATSRSGKTSYTPPSGASVTVQGATLDLVKGPPGALADLCESRNCEVLFCCIGFEYSAKVWRRVWPVAGERLVKASKTCGAPLIFMDNLYAFGPEGMSRMPLKEADTDYTTDAGAGKPLVRAQLTRTLLSAHTRGDCKVALVRASDFFGPRVVNSILGFAWNSIVVTGESPPVLGDPTKLHAQTYVPDVARALVAVAEAPDSWGRAWHVPSCSDMPVADWVGRIRAENGLPEKTKPYMHMGPVFLATVGLFVGFLWEMREMQYSWRKDYVVDSSDFAQKFPAIKATPLDEAVKATNDWFLGERAAKGKKPLK